MAKELYSNFRGITKVEVLRIEVNEGEGIPSDPMYREVYYTTLEGKLLFKETDNELRKFVGGRDY